jgi:hypothetical protein
VTAYAQPMLAWLPATSAPVRSAFLAPTLAVSASAEIGLWAAPEVASVTIADTDPPASLSRKLGAAAQLTVGAVRSSLKLWLTGVSALPALSLLAAYRTCVPSSVTSAPG